eukprot:COSAG01_NODE_63586_length_279_cov_1.000000_1_plen_40_part_01
MESTEPYGNLSHCFGSYHEILELTCCRRSTVCRSERACCM